MVLTLGTWKVDIKASKGSVRRLWGWAENTHVTEAFCGPLSVEFRAQGLGLLQTAQKNMSVSLDDFQPCSPRPHAANPTEHVSPKPYP